MSTILIQIIPDCVSWRVSRFSIRITCIVEALSTIYAFKLTDALIYMIVSY